MALFLTGQSLAYGDSNLTDRWSKISQTIDTISLEVGQQSQEYDEMTEDISSITVTIGSIDSTVSHHTSQINSLDGSLTSVVSSVSQITQTANDAEAKVNMIATYNTASATISLKSAMVNAIEQSNIYLSADKVNLNGYVTFTNMRSELGDYADKASLKNGTTTIDGGCITTGKIQYDSNNYWDLTNGNLYTNKIFATNMSAIGYIKLMDVWSSNPVYIGANSANVVGIYNTASSVSTSQPNGDLACDAISCGTIRSSGSGYFNHVMVIDATETESSANAHLTSSQKSIQIVKSGSSRRWKYDISVELPEELNPEKIYDIDVVQFKYNLDYFSNISDPRFGKTRIGFIAEDISDKYPIACDYDEYGRPEGWNPRYLIPPMLALIQQQNERIKALENIINLKEEN